MDSNTHSTFILLPGGYANVEGVPDECEHDWSGDSWHKSASGKMVYWHTYRQWASLCQDARDRLIYEHHEKIGDPIVEGGVSCRKCKKPFHPPMF